MTTGKHRFDTLIKTMIARIEYNNTLAPIQEYGRHQTQAKKKKKGKGGADGEENQKAAEESDDGDHQNKNGKANKMMDNFYNLDDDFIDDGDLEDSCNNNGLYGMGLGGGGFGDEFDGYHGMDDDELQSSHMNKSGSKGQSNLNMEYDPEADQKKEDEREQR